MTIPTDKEALEDNVLYPILSCDDQYDLQQGFLKQQAYITEFEKASKALMTCVADLRQELVVLTAWIEGQDVHANKLNTQIADLRSEKEGWISALKEQSKEIKVLNEQIAVLSEPHS